MNGRPDNYWAGAWFVGGVGYAWAWQSARVLSSTGATITVDATTGEPNWWFTGTGAGFLWGKLSFLDADNEWHLQTNAIGNTLYLRITGGGDPSAHSVEMKRRNWCVDINGRNYITVSGLNLWAGAVRLQGNGNVLQNCQAQFLSHYTIISQGYSQTGACRPGRWGDDQWQWQHRARLHSGQHRRVGRVQRGNSNVITRNLIFNTDYSGTYACCLSLHGTGDVVTFNTAHSSGRDIVQPEGKGLVIRFQTFPTRVCSARIWA